MVSSALIGAGVIGPKQKMFLFPWIPVFLAILGALFLGINLAFWILARALASQIYHIEREYEYTEAPSENNHGL